MIFRIILPSKGFLLIWLSLVLCIECVPVNFPWERNDGQGNPPVNPSEILGFMRKFGYLNTSTTSTTDTLYHEDAIIAAIKNMQKYGALNETGILDSATIKLLTAPRCGVADIPKNSNKSKRSKRFALGSRGWQKRRITYFIANWSPKVSEEKMAEGMERAFALWSKHSNLKFVRTFDTNADIIVAFGSSYHGDAFPFDGPGNTLAHAFYPYEMSSFGGDIHFDNDENWIENATQLADGVDFTSVAIHELGHSLGLAHSPVYSSIMFPYYKGPQDSKDLGYDDVMAMYELYIKNGLPPDDSETSTNQDENDHDEETEPPRRESTTIESSTVNSNTDPIPTTTKRVETTTYKISPTTKSSACAEENGHRFSFLLGCKTQTASPNSDPLPDLCEYRRFDSVALLRGEIFVFKNEFVWRLTEDFQVMPGYPTKFKEIFQDIPSYVRRIDAAYERKTDGAIVLFNGKKFWVFDGYTSIENSPRPITEYGFDANVQKVDAAMVWSKNSRTYLFSGTKFVRYDEDRHQMDANYPMILNEKWRGIPNNIDAAISKTNGKTYFFKGDLYWLYNNHRILPERGYPRRTSVNLLNCSD